MRTFCFKLWASMWPLTTRTLTWSSAASWLKVCFVFFFIENYTWTGAGALPCAATIECKLS